MYIYVYRKCMHICIFRDVSAREREIENACIYAYMYIEREREKTV